MDLLQHANNEVFFAFFVDADDGTTELTGLSIANTDVRLRKYGASTFVNKNSGGLTYKSVGTYYGYFDSTDTSVAGPMDAMVWKTSALPVKMQFNVLTKSAWDAKYGTAGTQVIYSKLLSVQLAVDSMYASLAIMSNPGASEVWSYATRALTDSVARTSQITSVQIVVDSTYQAAGSILASLGALNDITAESVWAVGTRALTDSVARTSQLTSVQTNVDLTLQRTNSILTSLGALNDITAESVWTVGTRALTDSVARTSQLTSVQTAVDLIHASMAIQSTLLSVQTAVDAGAAGITTSQIWEYASRTLTEIDSVIALQSTLLSVQLAVDAGAAGITTSQIWEYTSRSLTDSLARESQLTSVQTVLDIAAASIAALNDITADSVWAVATRSLTDSLARESQLTSVQTNVDLTLQRANSILTSLGALNDIAAADVWAVGTRSLTDSVARTSQLISVQGVVDNIYGSVVSIHQAVNSVLISLAALNNLTAESVWSVSTRALTDSVARTSQLTSVQLVVDAGGAGVTTSQIWEYTTRSLTDSLARASQLTSVQSTVDAFTGGGDATAAAQSTIIEHLEGIKGPTWAVATDSLEAIRDRGDAAWLTGGGMAGANAVTLTIQDDSGNNIVEAAVEVYDSAGTTFYEKKYSNSSGQAVYQMDDGTYIIKVHKAGYSFDDTTLIVSGATAETIEGEAVVITPPADPALCRVAIYLKFADGTIPAEVENWIMITRLPEISDNTSLSQMAIEGVYVADTGLLYWDIIQGATVKVFVKDFGIQKQITVPETATAELEELI